MRNFFTLLSVLFCLTANSQNVGIGTSVPNASAQMDVTATNKGILVPRLTHSQMVAIVSPANGLLVYNTDSACFAYRNATEWVYLKGNATASNDWSTKGNAGTDTSKNFIGTTDNVDLVFKRNNQRAGLINQADNNTSWGAGSLKSLLPGVFNNTAVGKEALSLTTTGLNNTANGYRALYNNISGTANVAIGSGTLLNNISGNNNAAIGRQALFFNSSGNNNVAVGESSLLANVNGFSNVAIGKDALFKNTGRSNLVAIGDSALYNNGTGVVNSDDATNNTAVGSKSLFANTAGYDNTAIGFRALNTNSTGKANTAVGRAAMFYNTSGSFNSAFGKNALGLSAGESNTAIGYSALVNNTGSYNTVVGTYSMGGNFSGGSNNTALGYNSGSVNTGSGNVFLGYRAGENETGSNKLYISNDSSDETGALLYGEFNNKLFRTNGRMEINSENTVNDGLRVIKNYAAGTNKNIRAVYGENLVDDNWGIGVEGKGGRVGVQGQSYGIGNFTFTGVKGIADGINTGLNFGIQGQASGGEFSNRGVSGEASGAAGDKTGLYGFASGAGGTNIGVFGQAIGGNSNYAAFFDGDVQTINGKLTVTTTAGATGIDLSSSDGYAEMRVIRNTLNTTDKDLYLGFGSPAGSGVHLYSNGSETVTIKSNLLGVGKTPLTSNNDSRLQVKELGTQNGIGIEAAGNTNHWDFYVPTVTTADMLLYYNGAVKGSFDNITGAYAAASDRRMKKDITLFQPVLNYLMQLQAYQYHYLDNKPSDRFSNGFMAQDVQKIFPDAVVENTLKEGETRLGINYQYFTVLAIKGLQEQQRQLQAQDERIARLEALVKALSEKK